jgi:hypothetical protein
VEEGVLVQQALAAPTPEALRPAVAPLEAQRRGHLLVATLLLGEAVWLIAVGFVLYWLIT